MFMHCMCVDILFPPTKAIPIKFERVTTHYQTLQTWIGHNSTRYHNFNALPCSQFSMVGGYLQREAICNKSQIKYTITRLVKSLVTRHNYSNQLNFGLLMFLEY